jgi:hypothetical protein
MMDTTANDPELDGRFLGTISSDFVRIADNLREAAYLIRNRSISEYPVFVLCKEMQPIGQLLFGKDGAEELAWNYYMSMGEEFRERGFFSEEGWEIYCRQYRNPDEFACLFIVDPGLTGFVFIPYPED